MTKKKKRRVGAPSGARRPKLSQEEMLERVPDHERLTTEEVQHIFNDCHSQTIYKMNGRKELTPYRTRNRGQSSVYKRGEVIAAINARFELIPTSSGDDMGVGGGDGDKRRKTSGTLRRARAGSGKSKKKAKRASKR